MTARAAIIGIDLGTTNSACAVLEDGKPRMIENALGDVLTPSVVAVDRKQGRAIVGRTAKDISAVHPHLAASQFKREMGNDSVVELDNRKLGAVELSAYVLNTLREDAERVLGHAVDRAVVTVPAYFNDKQRFATKRAAEVAGLTVERILNEPTAAAIAYGLDKRDVESKFAVIDLGGGTFDVCIMELFEGLLSVQSVAGESRLGGEDFTAQLAAHACSRAKVDYERMKREDPEASALLYKRCEVLKRTLSRWEAAAVTVPKVKGQSDESRELEVSAAEAWAAFAPLIDRLHAPIRAALRGADVTPDKLDEVVLVGGATRMPPVREFVERLFERTALTDIDPDLVVAHGAAVQAALCADDIGVDDIVVTDIASHSLGVNVVQQIATRYVDGFFQPVIHRNTVIPTSKSERFHPVERGQRSVHFGIYEGEARRVADNTKLGEFDIDKLPKNNGAVDVRFTYDLNGILEVEATVVETGKTVSHVFHRDGKKLSDKELEQAQSRMRAIRSGPRDRPQNRDLLARAELLWQEAGEEARIYLSRAITEFESALESRDGDAIKLAYDDLLTLCASLDDGERW